jgi:hypothetical protein
MSPSGWLTETGAQRWMAALSLSRMLTAERKRGRALQRQGVVVRRKRARSQSIESTVAEARARRRQPISIGRVPRRLADKEVVDRLPRVDGRIPWAPIHA